MHPERTSLNPSLKVLLFGLALSFILGPVADANGEPNGSTLKREEITSELPPAVPPTKPETTPDGFAESWFGLYDPLGRKVGFIRRRIRTLPDGTLSVTNKSNYRVRILMAVIVGKMENVLHLTPDMRIIQVQVKTREGRKISRLDSSYRDGIMNIRWKKKKSSARTEQFPVDEQPHSAQMLNELIFRAGIAPGAAGDFSYIWFKERRTREERCSYRVIGQKEVFALGAWREPRAKPRIL